MSGTYLGGDGGKSNKLIKSIALCQLKLTMSLDSTTNDVTITLESKYVGAQSSVNVYVYGAVTEKIGADSYDNGVKPHHNWRSWLLDSTSSGFQQLTLDKNVAVEQRHRAYTIFRCR